MKDQVQTRQDLLYLLAQASELEHSLACQYLYAAFSLKLAGEAGVTEAQAQIIDGWRRAIVGIAVQEMLHLGLASNLLTAIGGAPYFRRANFPQGHTYSTLGLDFRLAGASEATLRRFCCFELPPEIQPTSKYAHWKDICAGESNARAAAVIPPCCHSRSPTNRLVPSTASSRVAFRRCIPTTPQSSLLARKARRRHSCGRP